MSKTYQSSRQNTSGFRGLLLSAYYFLRRSVSLSFALFGVVLIVLSPVVADYHGVFGGMVGIWGASFVIIGLTVYALFWGSMKLGKLIDE